MPTRRAGRPQLLLLAFALLATGCSGPLAPLEVGHKEYPSDVIFGGPPPAALRAVLVPPDALVVPPRGEALALPLGAPGAPPRPEGGGSTTTTPVPPCRVVDPRDPPEIEAMNRIGAPPVEATYGYRNIGIVERSGANAEKRDYAVASTRTVQAVRRVGAVIEYEVVSQLGTVVTTTGYRVVPDGATSTVEAPGLYIAFTRTRDFAAGGAETTFDPDPNVLLLQLPAEVGRTWQSVGVDRRTGIVQRLTGTVRPKSRVDACGIPLDAVVVEVDGSVRACGPTAPNGVPVEPVCGEVPGEGESVGDPRAPRQTFRGLFFIGTQFGGLSLRDELDIESLEVGAGVFRRNVANDQLQTEDGVVSRVLAALVALVVLATSCTAPREPDRAAAPGARTGGRAVVAIPRPASLEPMNTFEPGGLLVVRTMCDPLVQLDPVTGEMQPALAESWQLSNRGRKITVKLRRGLRFSDGSKLTADDVAFTLSLVASLDYASFTSDLLAPVAGYAFVHGDEESKDVERRKRLTGVKVTGGSSFEITLADDNADLFRVLGHPLASPISRRAYQRDPAAFARQPVCAGPYRLAEPWQRDDPALRLVRSSSYHGRNAAFTRGGRGYLDEIELRVADDLAAEERAFAAGAADISGVAVERVDHHRRTAPTTVVLGHNGAIEYIGVPTGVAPLDRREVRRALSLAIDREALAAKLYASTSAPATGFISPGVGEASGFRPDSCASTVPSRARPEEARAVLREAALDLTGQVLRLSFNDDPGNRDLVAAVATQWREHLGVDVELAPLGWDPYLAKATGTAGFDGPFRMSWRPAYPSADGYLAGPFRSASIGRDNFARFSHRRFDQSLERTARRALDPEDRRLEYSRLEDILCEELPLIPVLLGSTRHLVRTARLSSANGSFVDRTSGLINLREIYETEPSR